MHIASTERLPERSDAHIRVYACPACQHEMRLTVWTNDAVANAISAGGLSTL